jgi:hypothetical protein
MRLFLAATTLTLILGFGTVAALADSPAPGATLHAAASDVRAPDGGQFVSLDRAFQRLELEAQIEDFYAELSREAQDLGRLERLELFYEAEAELRALVQGSETYAGEHRLKGEDYLAKARQVLAYHLGLDETPAQVTPFS